MVAPSALHVCFSVSCLRAFPMASRRYRAYIFDGRDRSASRPAGQALVGMAAIRLHKIRPDCRLALAIQRAENPAGKCDIYHYNTDGSLDWGYFQINTVHLERPGFNLRDLLDCKANIDFAHQLYLEKGGFTPWSTFKNGRYRQFMVGP